MNRSLRHLLILLTVTGILLVTFGCAQKDDVVQPKDKATITLHPRQLPTLDSLYVYELWMAKVSGNDSDYVSLGKFLWNNYWNRFSDVDGNTIDGVYKVSEPWLDYDLILVTIENKNDPHPSEPSGTIILVDEVVDPVRRPIELKFPVSFFLSTGSYFVGTPTNAAELSDTLSSDDSRGIWLCSRALSNILLQDTLAILSTSLQLTEQDTAKKYVPDTIGIADWVFEDSVVIIIGYDTIRDHRRLQITYIDTVDTNNGYNLRIVADTTPVVFYNYFNYSGPLDQLPDIRPYGWRYNAWLLLDQTVRLDYSGNPDYANTELDLPKVVPFGFGGQYRFIGDTTWGVLPLGGFYRADSADLSNEYISNREVPNFPGSDFVVGASAYDNLDLRRSVRGFWGSILVGIEPDPALLTIAEDRNFPIVLLSDSLRSWYNPRFDHAGHSLHNWTQYLPSIDVDVLFRE